MDDINNLPTNDSTNSTPQELEILQRYFQNKPEGKKIYYEVKEVLFATLIFLLIANPLFDKLMDYVPHMGSPLIKWCAKVVLFFVFFYITVLIINSK